MKEGEKVFSYFNENDNVFTSITIFIGLDNTLYFWN